MRCVDDEMSCGQRSLQSLYTLGLMKLPRAVCSILGNVTLASLGCKQLHFVPPDLGSALRSIRVRQQCVEYWHKAEMLRIFQNTGPPLAFCGVGQLPVDAIVGLRPTTRNKVGKLSYAEDEMPPKADSWGLQTSVQAGTGRQCCGCRRATRMRRRRSRLSPTITYYGLVKGFPWACS